MCPSIVHISRSQFNSNDYSTVLDRMKLEQKTIIRIDKKEVELFDKYFDDLLILLTFLNHIEFYLNKFNLHN